MLAESEPFPVVSFWRYHFQGSDECAERKMTSASQWSKCGGVSGGVSLVFRNDIYSASSSDAKKKKSWEKTPGQAEISITARQHEIKVYHYSPGSQ